MVKPLLCKLMMDLASVAAVASLLIRHNRSTLACLFETARHALRARIGVGCRNTAVPTLFKKEIVAFFVAF